MSILALLDGAFLSQGGAPAGVSSKIIPLSGWRLDVLRRETSNEAMKNINELARANYLRSAMDEAFHTLLYAPTYLPLHILIGELLIREGRRPEAILKFSSVANAYSVRGEGAQATNVLRRVIQLAPMDLGLRNRLVDQLQANNRVSQSGGLAPLYKTLLQNQIQGMIIEPFDFPALEEKKIRELTSIVEFNDPSVPHGLIMSKKALSPAEQLQWQALLNSMRSDGSMRRIFERYFKPELAAAMVNF